MWPMWWYLMKITVCNLCSSKRRDTASLSVLGDVTSQPLMMNTCPVPSAELSKLRIFHPFRTNYFRDKKVHLDLYWNMSLRHAWWSVPWVLITLEAEAGRLQVQDYPEASSRKLVRSGPEAQSQITAGIIGPSLLSPVSYFTFLVPHAIPFPFLWFILSILYCLVFEVYLLILQFHTCDYRL